MPSGGISRFIGPRHYEMLRNWVPSLGLFGASAGIAALYFSDWKLILQFVPIYNTKFKSKEE